MDYNEYAITLFLRVESSAI